MWGIERVVGLLDGDPDQPQDTVARCDAALCAQLHRRWFPDGELVLHARLARQPAPPPRLGAGDLVVAGGAVAGSVAAAAGPALHLLSLHTPGAPAKHRLPEVAASYRTALGVEPAAAREKRQRVCRALARCTVLCTNSRWTAAVLRETYGPLLAGAFPPVATECVGVEPPSLAHGPRAAPDGDHPRLLSMVRASPRKRAEGIAEAARLLARRGVTARWDVLCGGDQAAIAASFGPEGAPGVVLHPFLPEPERERLLRAAWLFVHPARAEHLGLGLLEALLRDVPVVASRSGGPPTYLDEGVHAAFFEPDSWTDLAETIAELLADRPRAEGMARAGAARVRERFGWDAVLERLRAAIEAARGGGS